MTGLQSALQGGWKKILALAVAVASILLKDELGLSEDQVSQMVAAIAAFMVGQGVADFGKSRALIERVP